MDSVLIILPMEEIHGSPLVIWETHWLQIGITLILEVATVGRVLIPIGDIPPTIYRHLARIIHCNSVL